MTTYSYDRENRLISQNVDGNVTSFAYDGFGRKKRESRGVNPDVILNWDGDQMIVESSDLDPEAPSKAYYIADDVIYAENSNLGSKRSRRDYAVDFLGSVTGLVDGDCSLSSARRWSAFGKLLSGSAEPIGYFWTGNTGSRVYQSLGLNDNRARHYGRNIKQWITRDPIWPSELPYAYVNGNPVTRIDPSGLWTMQELSGCGLKGKIIRPEAGDKGGVVVGPTIPGPPKNGKPTSAIDKLPAKNCTSGFKDANGRNCICVNGSFFSPASGWPAGTVIDCKGRKFEEDRPGWVTVNPPGTGQLEGKPSVTDRPHEKIGRTAACVDRNGNLKFLVVVGDSPGATAAEITECMKKLCGGANEKISYLDGSGSSQVATIDSGGGFTHVIPGDKRKVSVWIVLCEGSRTKRS